TPKTDFHGLYEQGQYSVILDESDKILHSQLDPEVLYYRMMSQFRLGWVDDALSSARVYAACRDTFSDQKTRDALRIILFYASPAESCYAGRKLSSRFTLSATEALVYFSSLMKTERYSEANELYAAMRSVLTDQQAVMMLLGGKASGESILYEISRWSKSVTDDAEFDSALISAIKLFNERGEGEKLLELALSRYDSSKDELALAIGDIYFTMGDGSKARSYWSNAYDSFAEEVKARITYL
ncbi:MAG: hypothetical protein ACI4NM_01840, partial [Bullifex sp.]